MLDFFSLGGELSGNIFHNVRIFRRRVKSNHPLPLLAFSFDLHADEIDAFRGGRHTIFLYELPDELVAVAEVDLHLCGLSGEQLPEPVHRFRDPQLAFFERAWRFAHAHALTPHASVVPVHVPITIGLIITTTAPRVYTSLLR